MTDALRDAAFGSTPGGDVFAMAAAAGADPRARWLSAVALGGQGHYAAAAALLRPLLAHSRPLWASLAASTLASHRRQLGAHTAARPLDAAALRHATTALGQPAAGARPTASALAPLGATNAPATTTAAAASMPSAIAVTNAGGGGTDEADGMDARGARCDALVGLAADAVGLGRLAVAARLLAAAEAAVGVASGVAAGTAVQLADVGSWRLAVRLSWVRAELELASGQAAAAVGPARDALQWSAGSTRHELKSTLVLAVALLTAGDTDRADALLHDSTTRAEQHKQLPLRWATELVLADLHVATEHGEAHRCVAFAALRVALCRADVSLRTAAESSLWVPSGVLQSGDSAERSSAGEIHDEICTGLCQVSTPRDR